VSFDDFYSEEHRRVYRSLLLLTGSREEAEDLMHDAFVRIFERWDRVHAMASPGAYLYRTALNLHHRRLRRAWRRSSQSPQDSPGPDSTALRAVARTDVLRALKALPAQQREALILVDFLDMSPKEAAETLRIHPDAVRARVHRARARMREGLIDDE